MRIDYSKLKMIDYEGAGNRTPILNIDKAVDFPTLEPLEVRKLLEQNNKFKNYDKH